jgi:hypothetical protein
MNLHGLIVWGKRVICWKMTREQGLGGIALCSCERDHAARDQGSNPADH